MIPPTRHPVVAVDDLPWLIVAEFDEQPGTRLTSHQIQRMWGLSDEECAQILEFLTGSGVLVRHAEQFERPAGEPRFA